MDALNLIRRQFDYDAWAWGQYAQALKTLTDDDFIRPLGPALDSLRAKMAHVADADQLWLSRIVEGKSPQSMPDAGRFSTIAAFLAHLDDILARKRQLALGLKPGDLQRPTNYANTRGKAFTQPLIELLQHMLFHGMYHRGQMSSCLRALGKHPPETDLVIYFRQGQGPAK